MVKKEAFHFWWSNQHHPRNPWVKKKTKKKRKRKENSNENTRKKKEAILHTPKAYSIKLIDLEPERGKKGNKRKRGQNASKISNLRNPLIKILKLVEAISRNKIYKTLKESSYTHRK
ncbi:hypothetical protein V6Z12_A01G032700 [Gossypium hirsutum]